MIGGSVPRTGSLREVGPRASLQVPVGPGSEPVPDRNGAVAQIYRDNSMGASCLDSSKDHSSDMNGTYLGGYSDARINEAHPASRASGHQRPFEPIRDTNGSKNGDFGTNG
jgi:hypothetical protein